MITEKVIGKLHDTSKSVEKVTIDWFERDKKLLRKTTSAGEEIGIKVNSPLNEGDILFEDDSRIIAVDIAPCDLINVNVSSMKEMGRLCFELGNRHLSLSISDDTVRCPYDEPTLEYLKKLGFKVQKTHEKFEGYIECRAHAHIHTDAHDHGHGHSHG